MSGLMRGGELRKTVNVNVAGKNVLRLVAHGGGDGNAGDLAAWARVTGCPAATAPAGAPGEGS
jgi:hypothetical protein